jgi:hypothetical protein
MLFSSQCRRWCPLEADWLAWCYGWPDHFVKLWFHSLVTINVWVWIPTSASILWHEIVSKNDKKWIGQGLNSLPSWKLFWMSVHYIVRAEPFKKYSTLFLTPLKSWSRLRWHFVEPWHCPECTYYLNGSVDSLENRTIRDPLR